MLGGKLFAALHTVTPRERRVSRNDDMKGAQEQAEVTPRERRVSRNKDHYNTYVDEKSHASREACE